MSRIVPDIISNQTITEVPTGMVVRDAAKVMRDRKIAAVVITDGGRLCGIMTERDITVRVVAGELNPDATTVGEVMTPNPDTLLADDPPAQALRMMRERNYRHLPVVDGEGRVIGMVSVRDLYAFVQAELESDIRQRDSYIFGETYGVTN